MYTLTYLINISSLYFQIARSKGIDEHYLHDFAIQRGGRRIIPYVYELYFVSDITNPQNCIYTIEI